VVDRPSEGPRDVVTGWRIGIADYRWSLMMIVEDADGKILSKLACKQESRSSTQQEMAVAGKDVTSVITWTIAWPEGNDGSPPDLRFNKEYVVKFFCFFKLSNGNGPRVDGVSKDAMVKVNIDTFGY